MSFRVVKDLAATFAAKEPVLLLKDSVMTVLQALHCLWDHLASPRWLVKCLVVNFSSVLLMKASVVQRSTPVNVNQLLQPAQQRLLSPVLLFPPGFSFVFNVRPHYPRRWRLSRVVFLMIFWSVFLTARKSELPMKQGTNCPFVKPTFFSSFSNTLISLRELFFDISQLTLRPRELWGGSSQTNQFQLALAYHYVLGRHTKREADHSHQVSVNFSNNCHMREKMEWFCEQWYEINTHSQYFLAQLCVIRETLEQKRNNLSVPNAYYYLLTIPTPKKDRKVNVGMFLTTVMRSHVCRPWFDEDEDHFLVS